MTANLQKILKAFAKELTLEVTKQVTEQLRKNYIEDITAIVKDCLNDNELIKSTNLGFATIEDLCEKYKVSRKTISDKCALFNITRLKIGKQNLVNETEFLKAHKSSTYRKVYLEKYKPKKVTEKEATFLKRIKK